MRKLFALFGLLALALPLAGVAGVSAGEGTLSVENGQGRVTLQAKGGVIGRLDRGFVEIYDLTPDDAFDPYVVGDDQPRRFLGVNGVRYAGLGLRFRLVGGKYRIVVDGRGIDLSVVAKGSGSIVATLGSFDPGVYSLDGADCRDDIESCTPLPELAKRFVLGSNERGEKGLVRSDAD